MSTHNDAMKIERLAEKYPQLEANYNEYPGGWRGYQRDQVKKYCLEKCGKSSDSYHSSHYLRELEVKLKNQHI